MSKCVLRRWNPSNLLYLQKNWFPLPLLLPLIPTPLVAPRKRVLRRTPSSRKRVRRTTQSSRTPTQQTRIWQISQSRVREHIKKVYVYVFSIFFFSIIYQELSRMVATIAGLLFKLFMTATFYFIYILLGTEPFGDSSGSSHQSINNSQQNSHFSSNSGQVKKSLLKMNSYLSGHVR